MIHFLRTGLVVTGLSCCLSLLHAQSDSWREQTKLLIYAPRYFGANAFPLPELRSGKTGKRYEIELRGEYHYYTGDRTKDVYARLFVPFAKGRAGLEVSGVIREDYLTTEETKEARHAVENRPPIPCYGDVIVSSFYQLLQSDQWCDLMLGCSLKTASGGRLCDARYTDAATYWFDLTAGRDLVRSADHSAFLRVQGMIGFYCWMTNDLVHRQNDATLYGLGLGAGYKNVLLTCDYAGFYGYRHVGDHAVSLRYKFNYEYKKNILSLRFRYGMKDHLFDTYSAAYIRCF
ncbi:MAG: hypothetical protein LBP98_02785 [Tannerella sp.]|jgi:hypothetical protein|nr:hypothetical protein [Tannerella sp.]